MKSKLFLLILLFSFTNILIAQEDTISNPSEENANDKLNEVDSSIYTIVDQNAAFQGGDLIVFRAWVRKHIKYPKISKKYKEEGRVMIRFVVNENGEIFKIDIEKSSAFPRLDDEAIRVIQSSPKWEPAVNNGINVSQQFSIPIDFRLTKKKDY